MLHLLACHRVRRGLREDTVLLLHLIDLRLRSDQPDDRRVEQTRVLANLLWPVMRGVDGHEDDVERPVATGLLAKLHKARKRRRADIAAAGEAEVDREGLGGELGAREQLSVRSDEGERSPEAGLLGYRTLGRLRRAEKHHADRD